jgi:hypothetical protein
VVSAVVEQVVAVVGTHLEAVEAVARFKKSLVSMQSPLAPVAGVVSAIVGRLSVVVAGEAGDLTAPRIH